MMSDNATTYTSAADNLTQIFTEETRKLLGREDVTWKFIRRRPGLVERQLFTEETRTLLGRESVTWKFIKRRPGLVDTGRG